MVGEVLLVAREVEVPLEVAVGAGGPGHSPVEVERFPESGSPSLRVAVSSRCVVASLSPTSLWSWPGWPPGPLSPAA